jgi:uncharacterized protein YndB with AHSA1/START domain
MPSPPTPSRANNDHRDGEHLRNDMRGVSEAETALTVRRRIAAPPERLFAYWTDPAHLARWWGPAGVTCDSATVDLRVGGAYRIGNRFADGTVLWISGVFEIIEPPKKLVYSWRLACGDVVERVTVTFNSVGDSTDVVVVHERMGDAETRAGHERGWKECLDGLAAYAGAPRKYDVL